VRVLGVFGKWAGKNQTATLVATEVSCCQLLASVLISPFLRLGCKFVCSSCQITPRCWPCYSGSGLRHCLFLASVICVVSDDSTAPLQEGERPFNSSLGLWFSLAAAIGPRCARRAVLACVHLSTRASSVDDPCDDGVRDGLSEEPTEGGGARARRFAARRKVPAHHLTWHTHGQGRNRYWHASEGSPPACGLKS